MSILVTLALLCDLCSAERGDVYHTSHPELLKMGMAREKGKELGWTTERGNHAGAKMRDICPQCAQKHGFKS